MINQIETLTGTTVDAELVGPAQGNTMHGAGVDVFAFAPGTADTDLASRCAEGLDKPLVQDDTFGDLSPLPLATRLAINAAACVAANTSARTIPDNARAGAGRLFLDADGIGAGAPVLLARLTFPTAIGPAATSATDFVAIRDDFSSCTPSGLPVRSRHPTGQRPDGTDAAVAQW